jgi:lipopolysaccharide assembly outer membrane protein LptD (OstA)
VVLAFAAAPGRASAQLPFENVFDAKSDAPFHITADQVEYEKARDLYVAKGNVVITQEGRTLEADWLTFSNATRRGVASGNVVIHEGSDTLRAEFVEFEVDALKGVMLQGRLEAGETGFVLSGERIRKTGPDTYDVDKGVFTTCRCPDPQDENPWQMRSEKAVVDVDGAVIAQNSNFDILGVPVLWFPWITYPLRSTRKTGFLFPSFNASSRTGGDVTLPYFWAVADNVNVIFRGSYLFERGFMPGATVEYVQGEQSFGRFTGNWIHDTDIDEDDADTPFSANRWNLYGQADQYLPWQLRAKADLALVSDNQWLFDFRGLSNQRQDRFLESKGWIGRGFGDRVNAQASVWYADDVQNQDDLDRDDFVLQRLPHIEASVATGTLGSTPLVGALDAVYTNYWAWDRAEDVYPEALRGAGDVFLDTGIDAIPNGRERNEEGDIVRLDGTVELEDGRVVSGADYLALRGSDDRSLLDPDGSLDDFPPGPERNGRFDVGEPLNDRGQRLWFTPRLGLPFSLGPVELFPEVGLHQTVYQTSQLGFENRTLGTGRLDARMRFEKRVDLPFGVGEATHWMEPRVTYVAVTTTGQTANPLFVPRDQVQQDRLRQLELTNLTLDPSDRIGLTNGVVLAVDNRIFAPGFSEASPPRLVADFTLSGDAHFTGDAFRHVYLDGSLFPTQSVSGEVSFGYGVADSAVSETLLRLSYSGTAGHDLSVFYRYLRDIPRFFEAFRFDDERFDEFEEGFDRVNQFGLHARYAITPSWALTYDATYSFEESLFLDNTAGLEFISVCKCWAIRAEIEDDRSRGIDFSFQYTLIGIGEDPIRPFASRRGRRLIP